MKLYATTTSERASKGQGGNKYIHTVYKDENEKEIASVYIKDGKIDFMYSEFTNFGVSLNAERIKEKGEKQKMANYDCEGCGATQQSFKGFCDSCKGINK